MWVVAGRLSLRVDLNVIEHLKVCVEHHALVVDAGGVGALVLPLGVLALNSNIL